MWELSIYRTEHCKVGLGICYDLRFGELGLLYTRQGAHHNMCLAFEFEFEFEFE